MKSKHALLLAAVAVALGGCNAILDINADVPVVVRNEAGVPCPNNDCDALAGEGGMDAGPDAGDPNVKPPLEGGVDADTVDADADALPDGTVEGGPKKSCQDLTCDTHAECVQQADGPRCVCLEGYQDAHGDGTDCVDKCDLEACLDDVATCSIVDGNARCACLPAYVGDGKTECVFDEACELLDCPEHSECEVLGTTTRQCSCSPGYEMDADGACVNTNECADPEFCGDSARCEDTDGGFTCTPCGTGFQASADGLACQDINECADGTHACSPNGSCGTNTPGSYTCDCDDGYSENPGTDGLPRSTLTGACEAGLDNCVGTDDHGTCESQGGDAFVCDCMDGYMGDGLEPTAGGSGCTRIPRCATDDNCGPRQDCADTPTGIQCTCRTDSRCPFGANTSCSGDTERSCTTDGDGCVYMEASRVCAQGDTPQTCFNNQCRGECAVGTYQCDAEGRSQQCGGDGEWGQPVTCAMDEICEPVTTSPEYGQCIDNPPEPFGRSTTSGGSSLEVDDNNIIAQPIIPPENLVLTGFAMLTTPNSSGGDVVYSLHTDNSGRPGSIIGAGGPVDLLASDQNYADAVSDINLDAGTRYWIVANFEEEASEDIRIYSYTPAGSAGNYRWGIRTYPWLNDLAFSDTSARTGDTSVFAYVQRR